MSAAAARAAVIDEHLARGEEAVEVHLLRRQPDQQTGTRVRDRVVAEDEDPTGRRPHEAGDRADQRRLTGTVRAEQAEEATSRDPQLQPVQRMRPVGVDLRQAVNEQRRFACRHGTPTLPGRRSAPASCTSNRFAG